MKPSGRQMNVLRFNTPTVKMLARGCVFLFALMFLLFGVHAQQTRVSVPAAVYTPPPSGAAGAAENGGAASGSISPTERAVSGAGGTGRADIPGRVEIQGRADMRGNGALAGGEEVSGGGGTTKNVPAEEGAAVGGKTEDRVWVFIPVNADGEPTGDDYYIPLKMFQNLYRKPGEEVKAAEEAETAFYFHDAVYTGQLRMSVSAGAVTVDSVRAVYDVEVLRENTRVSLPMKVTEIYLSPGGATLNGQPLQVLWESGKLTFDVPRPGRYTLELRFYPILRDVSAERSPGADAETLTHPAAKNMDRGISITIPGIARSRLEMEVPANMGPLFFPMAKGEVTYQPRLLKWSVQLGDAQHLMVGWEKPVRTETMTPTTTVEEFYHWEFSPRGMTLQCRYRYRFARGNVTSLEWVTDPRASVRALVSAGTETDAVTDGKRGGTASGMTDGAPAPGSVNGNARGEAAGVPEPSGKRTAAETGVEAGALPRASETGILSLPASRGALLKTFADGNRQRIRMDFAAPLAEQCVVGFDLHFPQKSSVGKHVLPYVHPKDVKTVRRWVAVSGSGMELKFREVAKNVPALTVPEFMFIWTELTGIQHFGRLEKVITPSLVVDDTASGAWREDFSADASWFIESRPVEMKCAVSQVTSVLCDENRLRMQYAATFPAGESVPLFCHLRVPENLRIHRVFLRENGQETPVRYSRISPTELGMFLENSVSGRFSRENRFLQSDPLTTLFPPVEMTSAPQLVVEGEAPVLPGSEVSSKNDAAENVAARITAEGAAVAEGGREKTRAEEKNTPLRTRMPIPEIRLTDTFFTQTLRTIKIYRGRKTLLNFENLLPTVMARSGFLSAQITSGLDAVSTPSAAGGAGDKNENAVTAGMTGTDRVPGTPGGVRPNSGTVLKNQFTPGGGFLADSAGAEFRNAQLTASLSFEEGERVSGTLILRENRPEVEIWRRTFMEMRENAASAGNSLSPADAPSGGSGKDGGVQWTAKMELLLHVKDGLLDTFTVELPRNWQGPFTVEPAIPFTVEVSQPEGTEAETTKIRTPQGKMRLILRPSQPFNGKRRVVITGPVTETQSAQMKGEVSFVVPRVQFLGVNVMQEDVILPAVKESVDAAGSISRWVLEGVSPVEESVLEPQQSQTKSVETAAAAVSPLPEDASMVRSRPGISQIYRVTDPNHLVRLQVSSTVPPQIDHLWVSHHILWDAHGNVTGKVGFLTLSIYEFLPREVFSCVVAVPETCTPLEFRLDGMPAVVEAWPLVPEKEKSSRDAVRHYRVTFHGDGLPRRLEILSYGEASRLAAHGGGGNTLKKAAQNSQLAGHAFPLKLPRLEGVRPQTDVMGKMPGACFVYLPHGAEMEFYSRVGGGKMEAVPTRPLLRMELIYMEHLVRMMQLASRKLETEMADGGASTGKSPQVVTEEAACWCTLWAPRWQKTISLVGGHLKTAEKAEVREYQRDFETWRAEGDIFFRKWSGAAGAADAYSAFPAGDGAKAVENWRSLREAFQENVLAILTEQGLADPRRTEYGESPVGILGELSGEALRSAVKNIKIMAFDYSDVPPSGANAGPQKPSSGSGGEIAAASSAGENAAGSGNGNAGERTPVVRASAPERELFFVETSPVPHSAVTSPFTSGSVWQMSHAYAAVFVLLITLTLLAGVSLFPSILDITRTTPYWLTVTGVLWMMCDFSWWPAALMFLLAILIVIARARSAAEKNAR